MIKSLLQDRRFCRQLWSLVLPIALQQFMLAAVSASDAIMLSRLSQTAMAAVSLAGQVQFVFSLYLATMTIGASMFSAQYWGSRDRSSVERILAMVLLFTLPVAFAFTLAAAAAPEALMRIFTPDAGLIECGAEYLRAVSLSYLLCGVSQVFLCIMKNSGRAAQSSLISSVSVVVNIVLNAALIFGLWGFPELGITGAAAATVTARAVEMVWAYLDSTRKDRVKLRLRYLARMDKVLSRSFWKYVTPVLGNEIVWGVGFTMSSVIMGHLGADAAAANSIAGVAKNLLICVCIGIGSGGGIMVGNALGAGEPEKAKLYGNRIAVLSVISGAVTGGVLLCIRPLILANADLTPQAMEYLKWMLAVCSCYIIGKSINSTVIGGIFCAGGDSRFGFLCDAVTLWGITVPLGLLAAFVWNLPVPAVYIIVNLDEILKLPAVYRHYKKYKWVRNLTKEEAT